jgi:hypothetical protein
MRLRRLTEPYWVIPLEELSQDMRSILRIQWREFIHEIEDGEVGDQQRLIIFLERCLKRGAA